MAKTNLKAPAVPAPRTHEGAVAARVSKIAELRRSVMACLLWEDTFYESGADIGARIAALVPQCAPEQVVALALEARGDMKLRHVPLLLIAELAHARVNVERALSLVIQRPDELTEFLALYWRAGRVPLSASVKRGLARAFQKFSAYALAKYNRAEAIKLRDVLFLTHAKPITDAQAATWKQLIDGTLAAPDTWEVALSSGADKLATWTRLLAENKIGALALLRNLRNMQDAKVPPEAIKAALATVQVDRILPFRFIAAARYAPTLEPELEAAMYRCLPEGGKLLGKTALVIDGSGSMFGTPISKKSELDRFDAAAALAILAREACEDVAVYIFSNSCTVVPPRRGFALRDALHEKAEHSGTDTAAAVRKANRDGYDRIIVVTDEQSHTSLPTPKGKAYIVKWRCERRREPDHRQLANCRNHVGFYRKLLHRNGSVRKQSNSDLHWYPE